MDVGGCGGGGGLAPVTFLGENHGKFRRFVQKFKIF